MISTYEEYLSAEKSISFEKMKQIHQDMISEIGNDEDALDLYRELVENAARYAAFRSNWVLWNQTEKLDKDSSRSACHDSLIVKFNQLSRYLKMQGKATAWRDVLGYEEENPYNRKRIGDFACYIIFVNSIHAR